MKIIRMIIGIALVAGIIGSAWVVLFHSEWVKPQPKAEEAEPETDVAVHTAKISRATLHRYVECFGTVNPESRREGGNPESASARLVSPVAGVVSEVFCVAGQRVNKGSPLFQLDDRTARSDEAKAEAALNSARASFAKLKASIRPEQIALAEIALNKARQTYEYAQQNDIRQKALAKDQLAAEKQLQDSALQVASAREDQVSAEKQLALLKNSPPPEELAEAAAKVSEAEKTVTAAQLTRSMLTLKSPITGTVMKVNVNAGELADTTNVIAELMDLNRLEVGAAVSANEISTLKAGEPAEVHCASNKVPSKAVVTSIGYQVDPKSDTVLVHALLPADSGLRPGQLARMKIMVEEHRDCLAVPEECVFKDKVGIDVVASVENNKSSLANVTLGLRENGLIEISGKEIKEGDTIVSAGAYGLPEETKVHIVDGDAPASEKK